MMHNEDDAGQFAPMARSVTSRPPAQRNDAAIGV